MERELKVRKFREKNVWKMTKNYYENSNLLNRILKDWKAR